MAFISLGWVQGYDTGVLQGDELAERQTCSSQGIVQVFVQVNNFVVAMMLVCMMISATGEGSETLLAN